MIKINRKSKIFQKNDVHKPYVQFFHLLLKQIIYNIIFRLIFKTTIHSFNVITFIYTVKLLFQLSGIK